MASSAALIRQLKEDTVVRYPRRVEEALGELSAPQRTFCLLYGAGETQASAYLKAYGDVSEETARANGSRILARPEIKAAVGSIRNWIESRIISNPEGAAEYCYERWIEWSNGEDVSTAIRATELIAKAAGLFVSRSEVTHRHILDLDQADAQLQALMSDLGVSDTIDAVFSAETTENKELLTPSIGVIGECCPMCGRPIEEDGRA